MRQALLCQERSQFLTVSFATNSKHGCATLRCRRVSLRLGAGFSIRCRRIESGELFVLNVGVDVRGYPSELSKTLAVINRPTVIKHAAHDKIVKVMMLGETMLKLGKSCRDMYEIIFGELDG